MARIVGLLLLAWFFSPAAASAEWRRAESPNFIVYSQADEAALREQVATLEDFDRLLRALTGTRAAPSPNKLAVYMVRGTRQLREVWPGMSSSVGGFYSAKPTGIAAFVNERGNVGINPGSGSQDFAILFHEYAHHFMLQYFPAAYPAWYIEGFAEFMSYTRIDGPVIEYGRVGEARGMWLTQVDWLPMERVLFDVDARRSQMNVALFYAQSWITVHYLFRDPARRAALTHYLSAYGRGENPRRAFESAFGMRPGQFESAVQRYARGRIAVTRITRASAAAPPEIAVTRLPASADDLLLLEAGLRNGLSADDAPAYLARIRRLAAQHPGDGYAMRVLARAEAFHGDGAVAERLLTPLLAAAPTDPDLLYLLGTRHLVAAGQADDRAAEARRAQQFFTRAHRSDPHHFPTLYSYAESLRGEPNYVSENTANVLLLAQQLAPQVATIRLAAAAMLMNRDRFAEAQSLLAPLAADPHQGGAAERARQLIAQARSGEKPGNTVVTEEAADEEEITLP